ncbi:MAG: adenylate kinase family protein [Candidatus Margulisiibacteriota bacterium]
MKVLIFLGAPGSGKGTQAAKLVEKYPFKIVSTGNLIRQHIRDNTPLGQELSPFLSSGRLVPDALIIDLFKDYMRSLDGEGIILDGFPRTEGQCKALDSLLKNDFPQAKATVFFFNVPLEVVKKRMLGRLTCKACDAVYHKETQPPKQTGICDRCGGSLTVRADDTEAVIEERAKIFEKELNPILGHYGTKAICTIDASQNPDQVFAQVESKL